MLNMFASYPFLINLKKWNGGGGGCIILFIFC